MLFDTDLLAMAVFGTRAQAEDAWRLYCLTQDPRCADPTTISFFPLVYRRIHPPEMLYKSVYRHTWCANQICLTELHASWELLTRSGFRPILGFVATLALSVYRDLGLRKMGKIEWVLPREQIEAASQTLRGGPVGLRATWFPQTKGDRRLIEYTPRRQPIPALAGVEGPSVEDLLFLVLFHSALYAGLDSFKLDALMILSSYPAFDWDFFSAQAAATDLMWAMAVPLRTIAEMGIIAIPPPVLRRFEGIKIRRTDRRYLKLLRANRRNLAANVRAYWHAHRRNATTGCRIVLLVTFPLFYKTIRGIPTWSRLIRMVCGRLWRSSLSGLGKR
jgi:hypothetical protein